MDATDRLLKDYVECFNRGVETGDFRSWLKLLAPDVTMRFFGAPVGPFHGREDVDKAYRRTPPDDEIEILDSHVADGVITVGYSWLRTPYLRSGEMRMVVTDGLVADIEITV